MRCKPSRPARWHCRFRCAGFGCDQCALCESQWHDIDDRCGDCGYWLHPPGPICPECLSKELAVEVVSGDAVLHTYTVNHQSWYPGLDPPYVVAIVELPEQAGLRLTTNLVGCAPEEAVIGMALHVVFEQYEDVWLPFFAPVGTRDPLLDDTRRLEKALTRLRVPCEARYYPDEIHAFHALVWRPQARACWRDALAFLDRRLR